ncbi:glycosyltransferase family 20 protein [Pleomassaria siparia CBS 279.74]|uniref:Glycosyltransferase family 20 protein n=1 Tax=Pleomassaria siparia CBS 279.74 TaxID=1314801 RepID=A0A6G1KD61_9PLEO|nr:glycosyltransferase family 20 protein [Pleomassaria siparia CBS 279.74]
MTTFVVSMFLPYTVDFHDLKSPTTPTTPVSRKLDETGRQSSATSLVPPAATVRAAAALPQTPAATETTEFFNSIQPSAATHFPKPADPKGLVRSDAHVPSWNLTGIFFNQPASVIDPVQVGSLHEYTPAQERAQTREERYKALEESKKSTDPRWATAWSVVPAVQGNGGLNNAIQAAINKGSLESVLSVGLIGFPTDALNAHKKQEICDKLEAEHDALTVFVSDVDLDGHYVHYCKTILWPVFHYVVPDHPKSKAFLDHSWIFYKNLNQAFADKVIKNYKRGDTIWIHDYHLLLVPGMIRKKLPDAMIGFFLHTAFPSSEVFRCLAARTELLEGMLGANLVAFQTHEYAHHFLQTCSRILAIEATEDGVQLDNHFVNVWSNAIGIDPLALDIARHEPEVLKWIKTIKERYKGKQLIVARDKLDSIRGVRQKLLAFELFLKKNPEWKDKVVLIQVATSTQDDHELSSTVAEIVTRIDANFSTLSHQPLVFLRQDIAFSQYLALLSVADALVVTSLREGMNLTCHEFVICQDGKNSDKKHGPVILSEFTGSASIFGNADLACNPWDYQSIANAIKKALEMTDKEKEDRFNGLRSIVMNQTGDVWMNNLSTHLSKVHEEHYRRDTMSIPRLNLTNLIQRYESSLMRLFVLDYEGTLASYGAVENTILTNTERVIETLNDLIAEPKNIVYVMSGRTIDEIDMLFGRVLGLGLIAENGCFLRDPNKDDWIQFPDEEKTQSWKSAVKTMLQYYVERVEGSWVEERHCSLIFHYEKAPDNASANRHAGDCANHINDACHDQHVKAVPTRDSVIIEPWEFDKATVSKHIFNRYPEPNRPDFLMVAGNDRDDEVVFKWAKTLADDRTISNVTTVTVGDRNSLAMSTLTQGTTGLLKVLSTLAKVK